MLDFLNQNSGALLVVFSFVVTAATVFYVLFTRSLVSETRELRKVETEPHLSIFVEVSPHASSAFDLVIANVGRGPAYDARFTLDEDWVIDERRQDMLSDLALFSDGMPYIAPGQSVRFFVGATTAILNYEKPSFRVTTSYKNAQGDPKSEGFTINFGHYRGMMIVGTPPMQTVANELKKISTVISHLESGFKHLQIDLWTQEDLAGREAKLRRAARTAGDNQEDKESRD